MEKKISDYNYKKKGYSVLNFDKLSEEDLKKIQKLILSSGINKIGDKKTFFKKTYSLQHKIYNTKFHLKVISRNFSKIKKLLKVKSEKELYVTSFVHLRAVKKINDKSKKSFLGFHRETFYSDFKYTKHQVNVSIPLMNYDKKNSMKIIDGTHRISDKKIKTKKIDSNMSGIHRYSYEHRLGLPYNPKLIMSGINLKKAKRINICLNKFVVFSAMLIHGNGSNNKKVPRYSIDFGLIKKEKILGKKIKDHKHIAYSKSGKYWEKLKLN